MVVWSSIFRAVARPNPIALLKKPNVEPPIYKNAIQLRQMSDHGPRVMNIQPSRFQWHKTKDLLHFYTLLGLIPIGVLIFGVNIFIGPATLTPTPEDYTPKHWEYHRHPISRFLSRYIYSNPQQEYEKMMHYLYEENERIQLRKLAKKIQNKMAERKDYQAYYYQPVTAKYLRVSKEAADYLESIWGN